MVDGLKRTDAALLELTARAISNGRGDEDKVLSVGALSDEEWLEVYASAVRGGVRALSKGGIRYGLAGDRGRDRTGR